MESPELRALTERWCDRLVFPVSLRDDHGVTSRDPNTFRENSVKEYDLFVPLTYNDGSPVEAEKLDALQRRLETFDGLTFFPQPNHGFWRSGERTYRDEIVIYRVIAPGSPASRTFLLALKEELERELQQEEILLVERDVRIL
jgi:hypothetical protein